MSKVTFRADDDLIDRLEALDTSKSEVMRQALRAHLDERPEREHQPTQTTLDESLDRLIAERIDTRLEKTPGISESGSDVSVSIHLADGRVREATVDDGGSRAAETSRDVDSHSRRRGRSRSGTRSNRVGCECGEELQTGWVFCPGCGRRTHAIDVGDR